MCDPNNMNLYSDDEMYLDGFKYDEIVGMLGPGLDNNFLDSVMGELDADGNLMDTSLELDSTPLNSFKNSFMDDDQENKLYTSSSNDLSFTQQNIITNVSTAINADPLLTQPIISDQTFTNINNNNNNNFIKTEPRAVLSQITSIPNINTTVENVKPIQTVTPTPQPHTILLSSTNYCNIKPAPPRNALPVTTTTPVNITQFQNVKPITIQSNVSVMPQVVAVQSITKDNQIFVQSPAVMYTTAKVQPVNTVTSGTTTQNINTFQNGNTLVFLDTADNQVPIHRVSLKGGKRGKRMAHNATEKKYRLSISSGIESLKNLVVGEDAKLQKSAILRKAVDYILSLQKQNRELRRQNAELIKAAKIGNVKDLLVPPNEFVKSEQYAESEVYNPMTPPRSDISNPSSSPSYSDNSLPSSPYSARDESDSEISSTSRGMAPHERITLCMFMFGVMIFNPFGSFVSRFSEDSDAFEGGTRRNILSSDDDLMFSWQNLGISFSVWLLNMVFLLMCLIKMLIYGDPVLCAKSKSTEQFIKHKKHAEVEFSKGNSSGAYRELNRCLQSYGQFLPTTRRECFFATSWQFIRMFLHRLWIGRFLSRKAGGLFCAPDKRSEALNSAKELSLIYHRLNQINLSSNMEDSNGLLLSLHAVNMAEAASSVMAPEHLVEIYMTAALRVKQSYPKLLQFFSRYYLNRAKHESSALCNKIPTEFQWVLTPYGYRFFVSHSFKYNSNTLSDESIFSLLGNKADPMSYVIKAYREHLLEKALKCLVGSRQSSNDNLNINSGGCRINDVLNYTQLLMDSLVNDSSVALVTCIADRNCCKDRLAHWWASILSIVTYWILGEKETAEKMVAQIDKLPTELYESADCLPKAFFIAFKAKQSILINKSGFLSDNVFSMCNTGTDLLAESLKCRNLKGMKVLVQFLACNWLLETRTALWEMKYDHSETNRGCVAAPSAVMAEFQKDLNSLRIITENISNAESRVFLYEAIYRLMAGAAPGPTHELLNRNMTYRHIKSSMICGKDRHQDWDTGEREKADAIFIANKYLPTNLFSDSRVRRGLLIEAINILEKIGDKNKLDECNQLLSSIGSSVSN